MKRDVGVEVVVAPPVVHVVVMGVASCGKSALRQSPGSFLPAHEPGVLADTATDWLKGVGQDA